MATQAANDRVVIFDTTLRDGEQSPGISLDQGEKVEIAEQLARLGVDVIEAGFPVASQGDFEAVQAIAAAVDGPTICGLSRTALADIDRCWEAIQAAPRTRIHTFIATSEIHMREKLRMTPEQVRTEAAAAVAHARQYTDDVEFSAEDATRSDWDYLSQVIGTAIAAGATTVNIPDTVGYTTPGEYAALMEHLLTTVPNIDHAIISVHCHDDLGMATANTLAAVRAGARQVEVTMNGIGERAGNTSLEEVVMALATRSEQFRGATRIRKDRLVPTSHQSLLFQNQQASETQHRHADQRVEDAPGERFRKQRGEKPRPVTKRKEPDKARASSARAKDPSSFFSLAGQRAEKDDCIQIDMRIQKSEAEAGRQGRAERQSGPRLEDELLRFQGTSRRRQSIKEQERRSAVASETEKRRRGLNRLPDPGHAGRDQQGVGACADQHQRQDVFTPDALAQHIGILGTDGDDEGRARKESGNQVSGHDLSGRLVRPPAYGAQ